MKSMMRPIIALMRRWLKFNAAGAVGICVQLFAVFLLGPVLDVGSLWATALAVEVAVLHNFFWHEQFTWADRQTGARTQVLQRLLAFNATTGAVSIVGNIVFVSLLLHACLLPLLAANLLSLAVCSVFNFLVNDKVVFRSRNDVSPASQ